MLERAHVQTAVLVVSLLGVVVWTALHTFFGGSHCRIAIGCLGDGFSQICSGIVTHLFNLFYRKNTSCEIGFEFTAEGNPRWYPRFLQQNSSTGCRTVSIIPTLIGPRRLKKLGCFRGTLRDASFVK